MDDNLLFAAFAATATPDFWKYFILVIIVTAVLYGISKGIMIAIEKSRKTSNPENNKAIKRSQLDALELQYGLSLKEKQGMYSVLSQINADERLLINMSVLSARLAGYLGPLDSGVFDEDNAVRLALKAGARCLIVEINQDKNGEPVLMYRDKMGYKQSNNVGSIERVAKSIAGRAFSPANDSVPSGVANDPLVVVLYLNSVPPKGTAPKEYVSYLGAIASQLQPLSPLLLAQTPVGDFRRQAMENALFYTNVKHLERRVILLCNVDTTPIRNLKNLGMAGLAGPENDLDLMVHARLYSRESPSNLGATSVSETGSPSAVVTTPDFWLNTSPDRIESAVTLTKKAWTIAMTPVATDGSTPAKELLKRLLTQFGVQSIPIQIFDKKETIDSYMGAGSPYEKTSWAVKPQLLRYIPAAPIAIRKPIPEADSGGGVIAAPK